MRLNEFIIFIIIFTIIYILFFIVYDKIHNSYIIKKMKNNAYSLIQNSNYLSFFKFYGIESNISYELIINIYNDIDKINNNSISNLCNLYNISNIEYIVVILYLEYLRLIPRKYISISNDSISSVSMQDNNMINKYISYFNNKYDYNNIVKVLGSNAYNDLFYIDKFFLVSGVRFINSVLYYYEGDL